MTTLASYLEKVDFRDQKFVGTLAFRNEEITLPDGSKMALGIDDGHWVLVYQKQAGAPFQSFEFDQREKRIFLDKKPGSAEEIAFFKKLLQYFFSHANLEDLVTILPPRSL